MTERRRSQLVVLAGFLAPHRLPCTDLTDCAICCANTYNHLSQKLPGAGPGEEFMDKMITRERIRAEAETDPAAGEDEENPPRCTDHTGEVRSDGWSVDPCTMTATYQSLPIPPPNSRSSSRASPAPTSTASAFSLTGLKRLFGGATPGSLTRSPGRNERSARNRDPIAEEAVDNADDEERRRPSVAKQHLASVVASLTGRSPASPADADVAQDGDRSRDRSESRSRSTMAGAGGSAAVAGPSGGESSLASDVAAARGNASNSPARTGNSETHTHSSSSRSRSRSRAPSASGRRQQQQQQHVVLPDGQRFVRPLRLSGASPSVRVSLQKVETSAILSSSSGGGGAASGHYGSYGSHGAGGGGRPSSEFRFPSQWPDGSPTLSEDPPVPLPLSPAPAEDEERPRRLSFTSLPGFSSLVTGRNSRTHNYHTNNPTSGSSSNYYNNNAVDDDARSVYSIGAASGVKASPSAYELMRRLRSEVSLPSHIY